MHASGLAGRYAAALFELAEEQKTLDAVADDLHDLRTLTDESAELERLIRSPVLSREEQARALDAVGERAGFHELTNKFLGLLAQNRRLFALPEVIEAYDALLAEHRGEVAGEVVSAVPLSATQLESVQQHLSAAVGQTVKLSTSVDPNLLGGLVARVGSRMIDASIRSKLRQLELALKGVA
jgi:F-type H+-transporting ATPase subunit delta